MAMTAVSAVVRYLLRAITDSRSTHPSAIADREPLNSIAIGAGILIDRWISGNSQTDRIVNNICYQSPKTFPPLRNQF
jgi:hypothetical protein